MSVTVLLCGQFTATSASPASWKPQLAKGEVYFWGRDRWAGLKPTAVTYLFAQHSSTNRDEVNDMGGFGTVQHDTSLYVLGLYDQYQVPYFSPGAGVNAVTRVVICRSSSACCMMMHYAAWRTLQL